MIRDLFRRLAEKTPAHKRQVQELQEAELEARETDRRETEVDAETRKAYQLAHRLAVHRRENHFEQRMRAAYQGKRHA